MFDSIETDKKYQCPSEFGLYKCDSEEDFCRMKPKRTVFRFHYFVILLTAVIILSAICLVTYNYISENNYSKCDNCTIFYNEQNITFLRNTNITTFDNTENITDNLPTSAYSSDYQETMALELRSNRRKDPRPFIYEIRDPKPTGFQTLINNNQNYISHNSNPRKFRAKNIQEIIKFLEQTQDDSEVSTSNKKYRRKPSRRGNNLSYIADPFFPYKPQNPSDINLLATNGFRFAPSIQIEIKKTPPVTETYPKYEHPQNTPLSAAINLQNNQQYNKRNKNRRPINLNNLYNHNNYFNQLTRFQQNRNQPYWNKPYWNLNQQQLVTPHPMILQLNVYPKKKKKQSSDRSEVSNIYQNCTEHFSESDEKFSQIHNATEFNQVLEQIRHSYLNHLSNDKVTTKDKDKDLFRIKHTILQLDKPEQDKINDFKYFPSDNPVLNDQEPQNIEVQKSIGFTVLNSNFSKTNENTAETNWRPIAVNNDDFVHDIQNSENQENDNYDLEVGEANENYNEDNKQPVTLPLPNDIFQKYFNTKPTPKQHHDWDYDTIQNNPNLLNHRPIFQEGRDE